MCVEAELFAQSQLDSDLQAKFLTMGAELTNFKSARSSLAGHKGDRFLLCLVLRLLRKCYIGDYVTPQTSVCIVLVALF